MECSCNFDDCVDEFVHVIEQKWVYARGRRKCCECRRDIRVGEDYLLERVTGAETYRTCKDCVSIRRNLVGNFFYGYMLELVENSIHDCSGNLPERCISRLSPRGRDFVCEVVEDCWEKLEEEEKEEREGDFKAAYDQIGKGRGFVRIHRLREALGWPREQFDALLVDLMADYVIELHEGNPSVMSERQIRDSFVDDTGILFLTVTWWGERG